VSERTTIADRSSDSRPYAHLLPVLRHEQARGNTAPGGWLQTSQDGVWRLRLTEPMDVEGLLERFAFPPHIGVERDPDGSTALWDTQALIDMRSAPPPPAPVDEPWTWLKVAQVVLFALFAVGLAVNAYRAF
jgi:hypothetical protein